MSMTSPKTTRYTSLNSRPRMKPRFSVHRSVRKVEKGSLADETSGQVFHSVVKSAAIPAKHRVKLRTYLDFFLRRIFNLHSRLELCNFCFIRFMKSVFTAIYILHLGFSAPVCPEFFWKQLCCSFCSSIIFGSYRIPGGEGVSTKAPRSNRKSDHNPSNPKGGHGKGK